MWYFLAVILIVIVSVLLILIVLVQNPKGGGLASGFSGAGQFGGVAQTNKFLEKTTWTLALVILGLSLVASISIPRQITDRQPDMTEIINSTDFNQAPVNPVMNPIEDDVQ
ncbi:MAG: preprotein translocase subunit SecG [Bacteroidales bacterium]|nr:preprotein translocase subunit SecG [Bacteroidales bacterium]